MLAGVYLYVMSSVKVGQVWESCTSSETPFGHVFCEWRTVTSVKNGWVQYNVQYTKGGTAQKESRVYTFIFMKLVSDVQIPKA